MNQLTDETVSIQRPQITASQDERNYFFDKYPTKILPVYLTNFIQYAPGGLYRRIAPHLEYKAWGECDIAPQSLKFLSKKRLNQSIRHFHETVDEHILHSKIPLNDVRICHEACQKYANTAIKEHLKRILVPTYLSLRQEGYTHLDLTI
jgi:hypothetical protein